MQRTLEPELLDALPPTHPDALRNRRDLRLTNAFMGNHRWMTATLRRVTRPDERILEVGAGTGELGLRLQRSGLAVDGLDRWPRPASWPAQRAWHAMDLQHFSRWADYAVVCGNLIFHQFDDATLREVGHQLQTTRVVVACEPARRRASQCLYRTVGPLLGANHVSLHDAHVSIAAGFVGDELPARLGLNAPAWRVQTATTWLGAYHLVAIRP